jgi:hypothetical protein
LSPFAAPPHSTRPAARPPGHRRDAISLPQLPGRLPTPGEVIPPSPSPVSPAREVANPALAASLTREPPLICTRIPCLLLRPSVYLLGPGFLGEIAGRCACLR